MAETIQDQGIIAGDSREIKKMKKVKTDGDRWKQEKKRAVLK